MGQDLLPRWPRPPHRCSPRGPLWRRMEATIVPPPTRCPLAPWGYIPRPTGWPYPEVATGHEAQGASQGGGTVGVTALCSETMGVHHDDGSERGTDMKMYTQVKSRITACLLVVVVAAGTCVVPIMS